MSKLQKTIKISSPGKIILSGEHAVVYGYPALLASSNLRMKIEVFKDKRQKSSSYADYAFRKALSYFKVSDPKTFSYQIDSKIPVGSGMGSSAALAVGMSALGSILSKRDWNLEEVNKLAYEIEKKQHGRPSGGDNTVVTYGGFVWYRKEAENLKFFSQIKPKKVLPKLFVVNSGSPKETTGEMVAQVRERYQKNPEKIKKIFSQIECCTKGFLKLILNEEKIEIGDLITMNERLLEGIGIVSSQTLDLIRKLEKIKTNVKVSGAGGKLKGSGILICYHKDPKKFQNFAKSQNLDIISVSLGKNGVIKEI